jgi:uncharacterized membrane protein YraQ (UPF0718 family)
MSQDCRHQHSSAIPKPTLTIVSRIPKAQIIQWVFVFSALFLLMYWGRTPYVRTLSVSFVGIVLEAFPFMLIGTLVGGLIEEFVPKEMLAGILPEGKVRSVFLAAGLGLVFPVCECAIVPVVRRLLLKGVPLSAALAFLLGGPIVNPVVAASTVVAYRFDWAVCAVRVGAGYMIAVAIGLLVGRFFRREEAVLPDAYLLPSHDHDDVCCEAVTRDGQGAPVSARIIPALTHAANDFFDMARFLVLGAFVAAVMQTSVDRTAFLIFAEYPSLSITLMMALAVVLNLCSEADAFVAASMRFLVPLPAQMGFMVLGPILDLKLLFMYLGLFRKRAILTICFLSVILVFLSMILFNTFSLGVLN